MKLPGTEAKIEGLVEGDIGFFKAKDGYGVQRLQIKSGTLSASFELYFRKPDVKDVDGFNINLEYLEKEYNIDSSVLIKNEKEWKEVELNLEENGIWRLGTLTGNEPVDEIEIKLKLEKKDLSKNDYIRYDPLIEKNFNKYTKSLGIRQKDLESTLKYLHEEFEKQNFKSEDLTKNILDYFYDLGIRFNRPKNKESYVDVCVCRHISALVADLMKRSGRTARTVDGMSYKAPYEIGGEVFYNFLDSQSGAHSWVKFEEDNEVKVLDPTVYFSRRKQLEEENHPKADEIAYELALRSSEKSLWHEPLWGSLCFVKVPITGGHRYVPYKITKINS